MEKTLGVSEVEFEPIGRALATVVVGLSCAVFLLAVLLTQVTHPPSVVTGWRIAIAALILTIIAVSVHWLQDDDQSATVAVGIVAILAMFLIEVVFRSATGPFGFGFDHRVELAVIFLAFVILLVAYPDPRAFSLPQFGFIAIIVLLVAIIVFHLAQQSPQVPDRWPLWAVVVAGLNVLVIPRVVPEEVFLWSVAGLATISAFLALPAIWMGEYAILIFEIQTSTQTIPLTDVERPGPLANASVFNNVNVFGLVTFTGVAAGVILAHRNAVRRAWVLFGAAGLMAILTGVGLYLSNSGVAWLAAITTLGVYGAYLLAGRVVIPVVVVAGTVIAATIITIGYFEVVTVEDSQRFDRWRSGIEAYRSSPSLLGAGHVSTAELTEPFIDGSPDTPHNSYLEALLRFGLIGGILYALVVVGAIAYGTITFRRINVGMLALASGWAIHHLFESYMFFHWTIAAVLSALAFGYLLFGERPPENLRDSRQTRHP